jgi:hypothetical protein
MHYTHIAHSTGTVLVFLELPSPPMTPFPSEKNLRQREQINKGDDNYHSGKSIKT